MWQTIHDMDVNGAIVNAQYNNVYVYQTGNVTAPRHWNGNHGDLGRLCAH